MPSKKKTIYLFEDAAYDYVEINDHLEKVVTTRYPEVVHSDFMADESTEFEELWSEVEEIEYHYWHRNFFAEEVKEALLDYEEKKKDRELVVQDYKDFVNAIKRIYNKRGRQE